MKRKDAQRNFVPGTSRGPRRATTLLAQVADLQRGERIKELRDELHLTQPVVAERVGVTLRAYQGWEAGGGIQWDNVKQLAKVLKTSADFVMSGLRPETPDLSLSRVSQLDRIEVKLDLILDHLEIGIEAERAVGEALAPLPEVAESQSRKAPARSASRKAASGSKNA